MARQIVVELVGDKTKFDKTLKDGKAELGGFKQGMAQGVGIGVFNTIVDFGGKAVGVLQDANQQFIEDKQSQDLLATSMKANIPNWDGNTAGAEAYVAAGEKLGFTDDEQRAALANLLPITHDETEAQKLASEAMDLARLKGIDLKTASEIIGKVHGGNIGILSRYGIVVDKNATSTEALAAIQKMAGGEAEAYAKGPLGQQTEAQIRAGESMEDLGAIVNGVVTVVLPIAIGAFETLMSVLTDNVIPVFKFLGDNIGIVGPILAGLGIVVGSVVIPPIIAYAVAMGAAALATVVAAAPFIAIGLAIGAVILIVTHITETMSILGTVFGAITRAVMPALGGAFNAVAGVFKGAFGIIGGVINGFIGGIKAVVGVVSGVVGTVGSILGGLGSIIGHIFGFVIGGYIRAFTTLIQGIVGIVRTVGSTVRGIFDGVAGAIGKAFGTVGGVVKGAINVVIGIVNGVIRAINGIQVHVHVGPVGYDFNGLGLGYIPRLHTGGIVPGPYGSDQLTMLQAGELVVSRNNVNRMGGGGGVTINIESFVGSDRDIDKFADRVAMRLRTAPR